MILLLALILAGITVSLTGNDSNGAGLFFIFSVIYYIVIRVMYSSRVNKTKQKAKQINSQEPLSQARSNDKRRGDSVGIFGSVKSNFKKSEAAVIVQKLLEMQTGVGTFVGDPAKTATLIIANAWNDKPDIFNGKFGQRPHKMSTAATALAFAIEELSPENPHYLPFVFAFSRLIEDYELNGEFYPFTSMDIKLLNTARQTFVKVSNNLGNEA